MRPNPRLLSLAAPMLAATLLVATTVTIAAPAQLDASPAGIESVRRGTAHDAVFALSMAADGRGLAVGAAGTMLTTADHGRTWVEQKPVTGLGLLGVATAGARQIAVGQGGAVLVRSGGGDWRTVDSGSDQRLFAVAIDEAGVAIAVGAFGTILKSADGGGTWSAFKPDWAVMSEQGIEPHLYAVSLGTDGTVTVAGEGGFILRSAISGAADWNVLHVGDLANQKGDASLFALSLTPDGRGYAGGQDGALLMTADGGASWQPIGSGTREILLGVVPVGDGVLVCTTYGLRRGTPDDAGKLRWQAVADDRIGGGWYAAMTPAGDGNSVLLAGHAGRIVRVSPAALR